jgi:hypothetical protein
MRSVLQLRTPQGNRNQDRAGSVNGEAAAALIAEVSAPVVRFREPQVEMAHGAAQ